MDHQRKKEIISQGKPKPYGIYFTAIPQPEAVSMLAAIGAIRNDILEASPTQKVTLFLTKPQFRRLRTVWAVDGNSEHTRLTLLAEHFESHYQLRWGRDNKLSVFVTEVQRDMHNIQQMFGGQIHGSTYRIYAAAARTFLETLLPHMGSPSVVEDVGDFLRGCDATGRRIPELGSRFEELSKTYSDIVYAENPLIALVDHLLDEAIIATPRLQRCLRELHEHLEESDEIKEDA